MSEAKGSFTVEAVLLIPFLIVISMVLIYYSIYVYDRALMYQDSQSLVFYSRDSKNADSEKKESLITEIKEEHPYLSVKEMDISLDEKGKTVSYTAEWILPVWTDFNSDLDYESEIYSVNPIKMMYRTEQIKGLIGE